MRRRLVRTEAELVKILETGQTALPCAYPTATGGQDALPPVLLVRPTERQAGARMGRHGLTSPPLLKEGTQMSTAAPVAVGRGLLSLLLLQGSAQQHAPPTRTVLRWLGTAVRTSKGRSCNAATQNQFASILQTGPMVTQAAPRAVLEKLMAARQEA